MPRSCFRGNNPHMKIAAVAVVFFAMLLVAIATFAPATLLDRRAAALAEGKLRIADAAGTLWRGTGTLSDTKGTWRVPIGWRVDPLALARDALSITLIPQGGAIIPRGKAEITERVIALRSVSLEIPAQALATLGPAAAVTLGGDITVDIASFDWSPGLGTGSVTARWHGARVVSALGSVNLGVIDATLAPQGTRLAGRIGNTGGDMRIDGTFSANTDVMSLDATIVPLSTTSPAVARALTLLGPADASGAVRVSWHSERR